MKRGDIVIIREPGTPASKARPCVIVQRGSTLEDARKITVCPLTSYLHGLLSSRPVVLPSEQNKLRVPSEVEIDWVYTHPLEFVGKQLGELDGETMSRVDVALKLWLGL